MKTKIIAMSLFAAGALTACAGQGDEDGESLPGDIDDNTDSGDGKADGWDYSNDPARMANRLNYRLSELPKLGKLDAPVWKDRYPNAMAGINTIWSETYFPSAQGSVNNRWIDRDTRSPLEKYDQAFNNVAGCTTMPSAFCGDGVKASWDTYLGCAGPAAKWHMRSFHQMTEMFDGVDNDNDGKKDECDSSDEEGPQGWWGLCHAWTPASLLEPEPQHAVTVNGVTFERSDITALIMTVYDDNDSMFLGGRCNAKEFKPDNTTSANDECSNVNPGALHVVITNFLGLSDQPLAMDRTAGGEVWNQPIYGYNITKQKLVAATAANQCVGTTGDKWTYNTRARKLYEVNINVDYQVEGNPSKTVLDMQDYISTDSYHYILEVDYRGKVIGGRYCTDSVQEHPDFLWAPIGPNPDDYASRNPYVKLAKVRELISLASQAEAGGGGGSEGKTFEAAPALSIPDNDPTGVASTIAATGISTIDGFSVTVNIAHSWRGDLVVKLLKDGVDVKTLHNAEGGSAQDLNQTYTISAAELAGARDGAYTLKVIDTAAADTGTLTSWKLDF
jgi:hypothetical protein